MTTRSTDEAMKLLKETRKEQLRIGRKIADELIQRDGSAHTRIVRAEMLARNLFDRTIPEFWLGALFNIRKYVWTGQVVDVEPEEGDAARNIHDRKIVKVWALA